MNDATGIFESRSLGKATATIWGNGPSVTGPCYTRAAARLFYTNLAFYKYFQNIFIISLDLIRFIVCCSKL